MSTVRIYSGKATPAELLTNGIGAIDAIVCNPYEEMNGEFSCTVTIPVGSKNSKAFVYGAIIKASTPRGMDLFRLEQPTVTLMTLTAKAWQISNDLGFPKVLNIYMSTKTAQQALTQILTSSADEQRFTGTSDMASINNMRLELASPQAALMNTESDCFLNLWGGELYRNNFVVSVMNRIGSDKGYKIALGKNLTGVTETPSGTGYTNRIIPKCTYAAMDQSELSAAKTAIDAGTTANSTRADADKAEEKARADAQYDIELVNAAARLDAIYGGADARYALELVNAAAKRDALYAAAEAQFQIDGNSAALNVAYESALSQYNRTLSDAAFNRDRDKAVLAAANPNAQAQYDQTVKDAAFNRDRDKAAADALCVSKKTQAGLYADQSKAVADKRFSDLVDARKADIFLPEIYIDSPLANEHDNLKHTKFVSCDTIKVGEKNTDTGVITYPDEQSAYVAMREYVAALYAKGADVPGVTIDITFVDLKSTEEYKQFLALNTLDLELGDTVHCNYLGRDIEKRVSAYTWNSLLDRYESITIGDIAQNIAQSMYAQDVNLDALKNEMTATLKQGEKYNKVYINHTDGFVAEATVGANEIKTVMNASEGISIYKGSSKMFYIDSATGNIIMTGAATKEDMEEFNNLITALDAAAVKQGISYAGAAISPLSGFTSSATIGEHEVVVNMSAAAGGLRITSDGVDVGGLFLVGGVPALVARVMANSENPNVWAEIGEKIIDGNALKGLLMYRLDSLGAKYAASGWTLDEDDGFAIGDSTYERVIAHSDNTGLRHSNGQAIIQIVAGKTCIYNPDGTDYVPGGATALYLVSALVVAGGGGGGDLAMASGRCAGGGGGGVIYNLSLAVIAGTTYDVVVGAGGEKCNSSIAGNGGDSSFNGLSAVGGGGGAYGDGVAGHNGGSGGGGWYGYPVGSGTGTQGGAGGAGSTTPRYGGGGGGGAGSVGGAGDGAKGGDGGKGISCSITGAALIYGGGGSGDVWPGAGGASSPGTAGEGGGGTGNNFTPGAAAPGTDGLGGGGGSGAKGGSGVVIIKYLTADFGACAGGTITTVGSYTIHTFTASGSFTAIGK